MYCTEVLVGAPFADDGRGAIALWQGGPSGLKINTDSGSPTVIYYASTLYPYLRGFGISIARPVDIDRNFYPGQIDVFIFINADSIFNF